MTSQRDAKIVTKNDDSVQYDKNFTAVIYKCMQ